MSQPLPPVPGTVSARPNAPFPILRAVLLWAGAAACVAGLAWHRLLEQWVPSRTTALLVLALAAGASAWALRRFAGMAWASGLALTWLAALAVFAGPLPVLATLSFAAAAAALGGLLLRDGTLASRCVLGLSVSAGMLGWLLPLPLHGRWPYALACVALLAWQRHALVDTLAAARQGWTRAVSAAPRSAALAVLALGLASTACWVPTMQADDLGYHLRLPWMLQLDGRYALDAEFHAWALAPWAADVLQAVPQLLAGMEARGAVNALWLALTAAGLWQLCAALGGGLRERWWTVALYASLPLTAALALGMQTETQTSALLAWAAVLATRPPTPRTLYAAAVLLGALFATKLAAAGFALLLLPWLLVRQRAALRPANLLLALLLLSAVGASSYAYAAVVAGNPVLPLLNGWFESPFFGSADFDDPRWHAGFDAALPWNLSFDTNRYLEAYAGGGGFVMVALAGAWILALLDRGTRAIAALALLMMALLLAATQYLRYVQPALVLALPALVVAASRADPRRARWLLAGVCALNLLFQANGHWMLRTGAVKDAVVAGGRDAPLLATYAPERLLVEALRAHESGRGHAGGNVLSLDASAPMASELGVRARTIGWYDPSLEAAAAAAERDASGGAWLALMRSEGVTDVLLRPEGLTAPRRAALQAAGARRMAQAGPAEWWRLRADGDAP